MDGIHTIVEQLGGRFPDAAAHEHRVDRMMDLGGHLPGLAEEFQGHGMDLAFQVIHVDGDTAPLGFVDPRFGVLAPFEDALRAFLDAELAHLAGGVDLQIFIHIVEGIERAQGLESLHVLHGVLMDDDAGHGWLLPIRSGNSRNHHQATSSEGRHREKQERPRMSL